jgi:hypothetical protein
VCVQKEIEGESVFAGGDISTQNWLFPEAKLYILRSDDVNIVCI